MKVNFRIILKWLTFLLLFGKAMLFATQSMHLNALSDSLALLNPLFAVYLFLTSLVVLFYQRFTKILPALLYGATFLLFLSSVGAFIDSHFLPEQMVEHALQLGLPVVFGMLIQNKLKKKNAIKSLEILTALTFIGHGFFALGINGVPDNFIEMTTRIMSLSDSGAIELLFWVGLLDVVLAVLIFVPILNQLAYCYMLVWGVLTSLARIYPPVIGLDFVLVDLPNCIYRLPHGLIPALLLVELLFSKSGLQFEYFSKKLSRSRDY